MAGKAMISHVSSPTLKGRVVRLLLDWQMIESGTSDYFVSRLLLSESPVSLLTVYRLELPTSMGNVYWDICHNSLVKSLLQVGNTKQTGIKCFALPSILDPSPVSFTAPDGSKSPSDAILYVVLETEKVTDAGFLSFTNILLGSGGSEDGSKMYLFYRMGLSPVKKALNVREHSSS
jgi:hypothetical protein